LARKKHIENTAFCAYFALKQLKTAYFARFVTRLSAQIGVCCADISAAQGAHLTAHPF